jgi:hypothetical protein
MGDGKVKIWQKNTMGFDDITELLDLSYPQISCCMRQYFIRVDCSVTHRDIQVVCTDRGIPRHM